MGQKYKLLPQWELSTRMNGSKVLSSIACSPYCRPKAINWSTDFQSETEIGADNFSFSLLQSFSHPYYKLYAPVLCNPFLILISYMPQFFAILFLSFNLSIFLSDPLDAPIYQFFQYWVSGHSKLDGIYCLTKHPEVIYEMFKFKF